MNSKNLFLLFVIMLIMNFNLTLIAQEDEENNDPKPEVKQQGIKAYSKYDFTPGEQVLFFENFESDAIGDFPARWNTNGSGEVVTLDGYEGKWFKMIPGGVFYPEGLDKFPDNFTVEFDVVFLQAEEGMDSDFPFEFISWIDGEEMDGLVPGNGGGTFTLKSSAITAFNWANGEYGDIDNSNETDIVATSANTKVIKISVWVQKQRARLYVNEKKVFDLPKFFQAGMTLSRLRFNTNGQHEENIYYIANLRVASGKPDVRNKLLTEGKLVTYGIYFDSGSDKVKPESYCTLMEIAEILNSEPSLRVMIIGHTDSDGDEAKNLDLSKRRGASVKKSLVSDFNIADSRIETDGKGESEPIAPNTTPEGKAANRRVEIIKL